MELSRCVTDREGDHQSSLGSAGVTLSARTSPAQSLPDCEQAAALARLVKPGDHWRLFPDLKDSARFVDIETAGLEADDPITLVGVADCFSSTVLVRGRDLTQKRLGEALEGAGLLVTFNGVAFDIPRLKRAFPGLPHWDELPHLDLALLGRRVGLSGGLKAIEKSLGHKRPAGLEEADGYEAVLLWNAHLAGDKRALPKLVRYCRADAESLLHLAPLIYERLVKQPDGNGNGAGWLPRVEQVDSHLL